MAKLSDLILRLLGDTLTGASGVNPVERNLQQQQLDNGRLTALAHLGSAYDIQAPQSSSPTVEGSSTPNGFPVPGMSGYTATPKPAQTMTILPATQDASGNTTFGTPINQPKGTKIVMGKPGVAQDLSQTTWSTATDPQKNLAISLYNGNIRPSDLGYRERSKAVVLANEYAKENGLPAFQSYSGETKAGMAKNLAYGKMGMNTLSLNTALGHASSAYDAYEQIGNTNQEWLNTPLNTLRKKTNDPNVVRLDTTLTALRGELANVFKNSGGTDQEIAQWKDNLNQNLTPSQFNAVLPQVDELLRSRLGALEYQQQDVMDNQPARRTLLSPKASKTSKKLKKIKESGSPTLGSDPLGIL